VEKIWLKHYPPEIPAEINPDAFPSLPDMFRQVFSEFADRPAFYNMGTVLTYAKLDELSGALAAYFQQVLGLQKGDRIAIMMPNILQYPVTLFAALRAGLTVVNVNPLYTAHELSKQLKDSGATAIVVLSLCAKTVQDAIAETSVKSVIVTNPGDLFPRIRGLFADFYMRYIKRKIPHYWMTGLYDFRTALHRGKKLTMRPVSIQLEDIAFLQYTGGTTGISKGAMLTHRNMVANILQAEAWFAPITRRGRDVMLAALPLYHIFSLTANCFFISKTGGLNVLISNPRDVSGMIREMAKFRFTIITGVNTLFMAMLKSPLFSTLDFSDLKLGLGGGMAVQRVVAEKWREVTGTVLLEAYGLTETSPCATANPWNLKEYNGTVGLPLPSTDVCVLDENQQEVPLGETGELAIRGPQVMAGYWNTPSETENVFTKGGWLLTGDIVSIDKQGYVRIRERKKDMILVSGFNVYPNEVEDVLVALLGVREVAVIGVPDPHSGEAIKAFVVSDRPDLTSEEVIRYSHQNLTGYKVPKYVEFRTELPKTNVGKILRRALRVTHSSLSEGGEARTGT